MHFKRLQKEKVISFFMRIPENLKSKLSNSDSFRPYSILFQRVLKNTGEIYTSMSAVNYQKAVRVPDYLDSITANLTALDCTI